jgi:hypothetical protein
MPRRRHAVVLQIVLLLAGLAGAASGAPRFTISADGSTFLYPARPGESPTQVAESFGIPEAGVAAFLRDNGIADATRIPLGFEYRIPNPLAPRLDALASQVDGLERDLAARTARTTELERALEKAQAAAVFSEGQARRLEQLERRWPIAMTGLIVALLGLGGALWISRLSLTRLTTAEQRVRSLAQELEERRRSVLSERQETGRHIIELENRVRQLERPRLARG